MGSSENSAVVRIQIIFKHQSMTKKKKNELHESSRLLTSFKAIELFTVCGPSLTSGLHHG